MAAPPPPLVAALAGSSEAHVPRSYVQAMAHMVVPFFKLPLWYPVDVNGESGFIFSEA